MAIIHATDQTFANETREGLVLLISGHHGVDLVK